MVSGAALLILSVVLGLSVFPVPDVPWRYLPYLFLFFVLLGMGISRFYLRRDNSKNEQVTETNQPEKVSSVV
jgi:hypothetical protein